MVETLVLGGFALMLVGGIVLGMPLWLTLLAGTFLFSGYGLAHGHRPAELVRMATKGIRSVAPILILFAIIGALTASWRAAGTIAQITCWSVSFVTPGTLVLCTFLLCCVMSFLVGSSFAAAATTGVVCLTIGRAMGVDLTLLGGAVLSGCFFGDRCSPMSSSAALVCNLTSTQQNANVRRMALFAVVPLVASGLIYAVLGGAVATTVELPDFAATFERDFVLTPLTILPVVVMLVLSLAHVSVKATMLASLAVAVVECVTLQGIPLEQIPGILVFGYHTADPAVASMVNGGGVMSMADVAAIIIIASTYSGLFDGTGLLSGLQDSITKIARRTTAFTGVLLTSIVTSLIACDQVVATMLTAQLCTSCEHSGSALALDLENSCVMLPALVPWSTSAVAILSFIGAPTTSVVFAVYAMAVPLWTLAVSVWERSHPDFVDGRVARAMGLETCDDFRRLAPVPADGFGEERLAA
jgi:NhaC family Na+:H+ antiporter